ncbi:MAG: DUF4416 family protein [Spirochaetia bacterium]|jgi:hypothetical protein
MGTAGIFRPEKLVIGVLASPGAMRQELRARLEERWGPVDFTSQTLSFTFTDYYNEEMGTPIERCFVSFERLVDPSLLPRIKRESNETEDLFREQGRRKVNLDPGLLSLPRFVLATTKENAHRIPLADGIFAEITLLFGKGSFRPLPWTYPDYCSEAYIAILNGMRARYKAQLKLPEPG